MPNLSSLLSLNFWLWFSYFLIPANLFLYGINDIYDEKTDVLNFKKQTHEHQLMTPERKMLIQSLIGVASLSGFLAFLSGWRVALALGIFITMSYAYSAPPLRFKARAFFDSYSNFLYIMPAVIGYLLNQPQLPSWWLLVAGASWAVGMHLYSAIPDQKPDQQAGIITTAVKLGTVKSLWVVLFHWSLFAIILISQLGFPAQITLIYPALISILLIRPSVSISKLYWIFPYLNAGLGFVAFWVLLISRFGKLI